MNLSWNKFSETAEKAFRDLGSSGDFSDVTLAGADGKFVEAHKVILSSCSPVLKSILMKISHSHPLLYMKGMNTEDISLLLKFIYTGEVTLEKESLERFLETADELQIAGLTKPAGEKVAEMDVVNERKEEKEPTKPDNNSEIKDLVNKLETEIESMEESLKSDGNSEVEDSANLETEPKESINKETACEYPGCEKEFSTRANLRAHQRAIHEGITHNCLDCSFKTGFSGNLKKHKQKVHGGNDSIANPMDIEEEGGQVQLLDSEEPLDAESDETLDAESYESKPFFDYLDSGEAKSNACDRCGIENKSGKALMKHRREEHPGQSFLCKECGKEFASNNNLNIHKKAVHELVKYPCDDCDHQSTNKSYLSKHKKTKHTA